MDLAPAEAGDRLPRQPGLADPGRAEDHNPDVAERLADRVEVTVAAEQR
jgi:hypothetical protein